MATYTIEPPPTDQSAPAKSKYTIEPPPASDKPAGDNSYLGTAARIADPGPFIKGVGQGIIGIPEAIYQYGEHTIGLPHPGHWADPLRRYQKDVESTWGGLAGETVGNIGAFIGGGELAGLARLPGLARTVISSPGVRRFLSTVGQSQISQPAQGDDFWAQKGESAGLAAILDRWLGRPLRQAAHNTATGINEEIASQNQAAATRTAEANRTARENWRTATETDQEQHRALSDAQERLHQQEREAEQRAADAVRAGNREAATQWRATADTLREQHQRLSDAQEQLHQQQRATAQSAADAMTARTNEALEARRGQLASREAVPAATTQGWWQRTLDMIGVSNPAVTRAAPATGAKVRDIVGGRLNRIMEDMHLDPSDPAFIQHVEEIRDEVGRNLPENERAGWFHKPPEPELDPLLVHPTTGKPLERTTRGVKEREPAKPTGTFYRTVIAPLAKGPMTGRELTNYVSRIGARAEELAREAAVVPRERRAVLQAQADALRNVEDAVIGHAAGSPEQKAALETARRAYFMWAIGNDAARASRGGVATPEQLINSMTRRLRGEARYEQALNDPASPYHDMTNWLQAQRDARTARVPSEADVRRSMPTPPRALPAHPTPIPPPSIPSRPRMAEVPPVRGAHPTPIPAPAARPRPRPQQPPTPTDPVPVPPEPRRPTRNIPRAVGQAGLAGVLAAMHHPIMAATTAGSAVRDLIGRSTGGREKFVESLVRQLMENAPRADRLATAAGPLAAQAPRVVPEKTRKKAEKIGQTAADALSKPAAMAYRWVSPP